MDEETNEWDFSATCWCYYNLEIPGVSDFLPWLDAFIAHCNGDSDGRAAILNLGTLMNGLTVKEARQVPADLVTVGYHEPPMIQRFARLWDKISEILERSQYRDEPTGTLGLRFTAEWTVAIGNEINLYLDNPDQELPPGVSRIDGTPAQAWASYRQFYEKAVKYVMGQEVDLTGDGQPDPNRSRLGFIRLPGFTTTWHACGPGWRVANRDLLGEAGSSCEAREDEDEIRGHFMTMAGLSSRPWIYTRYPENVGPRDSPPAFQARIFREFVDMAEVARTARDEGFMSHLRPIVIQEMGFHTGFITARDNLLVNQQTAMVRHALRAWSLYNQLVGPPLSRLWQDLFDGRPAPSAENPRIIGFNWFMLHDFWDGRMGPPSCPFKTAAGQDDPVFCSWGLIDQVGEEKRASDADTGSWTAFRTVRERIREMEPDFRAPNRQSCP